MRPCVSVAGTLVSILPEVSVLVGMTVAFLVLARVFARRWEAA